MTGLAASRAPRPEAPTTWSLTCAVVDDSLIDRYLICHAVKEVFDDSRTVEFATASEARDYLASGAVDIILADRMLPDGDGAEFALSPPNGTAVVLLSGEDCSDVISRLTDAGRSAFLHKDDLNAETLAEALLPLIQARAEVVPIRPDIVSIDAPESETAPVVRGLRLLRTIRSRRDRTGADEVAELLSEIEQILLGLRGAPPT